MKFRTWSVLFIIIIILVLVILVINHKTTNIENIAEQKDMKIESGVFVNNGEIPVEYTCHGKGTQIPLKISKVPEEAKSLALIIDDPDAPSGDFVHWVVWNINPKTSMIENSNALGSATEGYTSLNKPGFVPPCPPFGIHHYNFKLYALDTILSIPKSSNKNDLLFAMNKHTIDNAILVGLYGK